MVAELPICQYTFLAWAPLLRKTFPPAPPFVVKAEPTWKIQTASESPCASSVRLPDWINKEEVDISDKKEEEEIEEIANEEEPELIEENKI